jgi:serine/threonine protein kinase
MTALYSLFFQTNIRIDDRGTARIAGFASAMLLLGPDVASGDVDESAEFNVSRWCSPEILHPDGFGLTKAKATKASDMYAFGMLAYEVGSNFCITLRRYSIRAQIFSGRLPFYDSKDTAVVVTVITSDKRPSRPAHPQLSDQLWDMIEKCWRRDPSQRATIQEVVKFLET